MNLNYCHSFAFLEVKICHHYSDQNLIKACIRKYDNIQLGETNMFVRFYFIKHTFISLDRKTILEQYKLSLITLRREVSVSICFVLSKASMNQCFISIYNSLQCIRLAITRIQLSLKIIINYYSISHLFLMVHHWSCNKQNILFEFEIE